MRGLPFVLSLLAHLPAAQGQGLFTGQQTVNLGGPAFSPALTEDELYLVFARPATTGSYDLWEAQRGNLDAPWGPATAITGLNTPTNDESRPDISFDGTELYFVRAQPGVPASATVMVSQRTMSGWTPPVPVPGAVNQTGVGASDPHLTTDGLGMFFIAPVGTGAAINTVTRTSRTGAWMQRQVFPVSGSGLHSPLPLGDGGVVLFGQSGVNSSDFYLTWRQGMGWATPVLVTDVSTTGLDSNADYGESSGRLYTSQRSGTVQAALVYCPDPDPPGIAGMARTMVGIPLASGSPPYIAILHGWTAGIGTTVNLIWYNWLRPPSPGVGALFLTNLPPMNPTPHFPVAGFRGGVDLNLTGPLIPISFPVLPSGLVATPLSIPNNPGLRGAKLYMQLARVSAVTLTGGLSQPAVVGL